MSSEGTFFFPLRFPILHKASEFEIVFSRSVRIHSFILRRESLCLCGRLRSEVSEPLKPFMCLQRQSYRVSKRVFPYRDNRRREIEEDPTELGPESVELNTENNVARFSLGGRNSGIRGRRVKMSKKVKVKELKFFRLLARRKMRSPNPAVRIQYKIAKVWIVCSCLEMILSIQSLIS